LVIVDVDEVAVAVDLVHVIEAMTAVEAGGAGASGVDRGEASTVAQAMTPAAASEEDRVAVSGADVAVVMARVAVSVVEHGEGQEEDREEGRGVVSEADRAAAFAEGAIKT
jgi:hypothetical protein